jgi:hypothetical protein
MRSMLPDGMALEPLAMADQRRLCAAHPGARTAARLLRGACSCDLVVQRHAVTREDEAWLRRRYRALGLTRPQIITAIARHRRSTESRPRPADYWPAAVTAFVAEHARNAGPTLYLLHFSHDGSIAISPAAPIARMTADEVRHHPGEWLAEDSAVVVNP